MAHDRRVRGAHRGVHLRTAVLRAGTIGDDRPARAAASAASTATRCAGSPSCASRSGSGSRSSRSATRSPPFPTSARRPQADWARLSKSVAAAARRADRGARAAARSSSRRASAAVASRCARARSTTAATRPPQFGSGPRYLLDGDTSAHELTRARALVLAVAQDGHAALHGGDVALATPARTGARRRAGRAPSPAAAAAARRSR